MSQGCTQRNVARILAALVVAGGLAGCGGGGGSDARVSASSLKKRLPPGDSVPGFSRQRTFDWSDPVDLAVEGFTLPEATHPSEGVNVLRKAGMIGGAGERLVKGQPPEESLVTIGVAKFKSAKGARQAQRWVHDQDLQQPCFSKCIYSPSDLAIVGVPNSTGVQQVPSVKGPPTHFLVEFVVGPYLYLTTADGGPGDAKTVVAGAQGFYQAVKGMKD